MPTVPAPQTTTRTSPARFSTSSSAFANAAAATTGMLWRFSWNTGNVQRRAEPLVNAQSIRRGDVLEHDPAESRLEPLHRLDEDVGVFRVDFEVEHVDVGEPLEQQRESFLHRLRRQRADVAEPGHGRTVRDQSNEVAVPRVAERLVGVGIDRFTRPRRARQVRQAHLARRQARLDRPHLDLSRPFARVILE